MKKEILNKNRTLESAKQILTSSKFSLKNKFDLELLINLENLLNSNSFEIYVNSLIKEIENLKEDDINIIKVENELKIYNNQNKKKYLKKEIHDDLILYEYSTYFAIFLKNNKIDITQTLKNLIGNNDIKSIWINDEKYKENIFKKNVINVNNLITFIDFKNLGPKIMIYISK